MAIPLPAGDGPEEAKMVDELVLMFGDADHRRSG